MFQLVRVHNVLTSVYRDYLFSLPSDDLFSLPYCPGKTLVIGASYVSLECAGFLASLGLDTTVMVRSILLRGFDQQCADLIGDYMINHGVKFMRPCVPTKVRTRRRSRRGFTPCYVCYVIVRTCRRQGG